jgi:hypothetical protein
LRALLRAQAQALGDEAVGTGGQVPAERVEALGRLAKLVEICEAAELPPPKQRWRVPAVLVGTLAVASVLLFVHLPEAEIELDVQADQVGFVLAEAQVVSEVMSVAALGVSGLAETRLPRVRDREARTVSAESGMGSDIRLTAEAEGGHRGSLTLPALTLPAGTRVWVSLTDVPHQYHLSLRGQSPDLRVDVHGRVRVGFAGAPPEEMDVASPRPIVLRTRGEEVDLEIAFADPPPPILIAQLGVRDLSFVSVQELQSPERSLVRTLSTVRSGVLYIESLNGQSYTLRPGERLRFGASHGEIRRLHLGDDHLGLRFHGWVRDMTSGSTESRRSLMPTLLEWLRARHGLGLLWATTLYVSGLLFGVLRWWKGQA